MFKTQNFCHIASNNRNQVKAGVFVYRTTDNLATVSASGYFNARIIDINLHDLIIHEKIDSADATKVERNVLCVTERTLENVGVTVIKSKWEEDIEGDIEDLDGKIAALKTYVEQHFVNIDGSSIMSGPLKFRAGSFVGAIAGGLGDGVSFYKLKSDNTIDSEVASLTKTNGFTPGTTNTMNIGSSSLKWKDAHIGRVITSVLNNGANINVPTTSGTLALKSDIGIGINNVTNCITEIPQDIKLEIDASNQFIIKSGSKVYYGDSTYSVLDSNKTYPASTFWGNQQFVFFIVKSTLGIGQATLANTSSDASNPGGGYRYWFNTTDGKCYINDGNGVASEASFPVGIVQHTNGTGWTNIDNIFNGFGYIARTLFVLPGVKGLIPNGRNADGTLKNNPFTVNTVLTSTFSGTHTQKLVLNGSGMGVANATYNEITNYTSPYPSYCIAADISTSSGKITALTPKTVFHAVDYNDYQKTVSQVNINTANKQDEATAVNYGNITNCITEIPQDIIQKTSALFSAGSKVYFPDGTYVVLSQDIGFSGGYVAASKCFGVVPKNLPSIYNYIPVDHCFSGSTAPTGLTSGVNYLWLDTSASPYVIKRTNDAGATWVETDYSLPLCTLSMSSGFPSSVDQVFNGFGYFGTKIFVLPGVKGLAPNGRNSDGSLKNTVCEITTVKLADSYNSKYLMDTGISPASYTNYAEQTEQPSFTNGHWYNPAENILYKITSGVATKEDSCYVLDVFASGSGIQPATGIRPKQVFNALDYNDRSVVSGWSLPSNKVLSLTLGASDTFYKAPANGWFYLEATVPTSGYAVRFVATDGTARKCQVRATAANQYCVVPLYPAREGESVQVHYDGTLTSVDFKFIYAQGER